MSVFSHAHCHAKEGKMNNILFILLPYLPKLFSEAVASSILTFLAPAGIVAMGTYHSSETQEQSIILRGL